MTPPENDSADGAHLPLPLKPGPLATCQSALFSGPVKSSLNAGAGQFSVPAAVLAQLPSAALAGPVAPGVASAADASTAAAASPTVILMVAPSCGMRGRPAWWGRSRG